MACHGVVQQSWRAASGPAPGRIRQAAQGPNCTQAAPHQLDVPMHHAHAVQVAQALGNCTQNLEHRHQVDADGAVPQRQMECARPQDRVSQRAPELAGTRAGCSSLKEVAGPGPPGIPLRSASRGAGGLHTCMGLNHGAGAMLTPCWPPHLRRLSL